MRRVNAGIMGAPFDRTDAMSPSAYPQLLAVFTKLHNFQHLAAIAAWDQSAKMPPKGNEARSKALAEMDVLVHQTVTDPVLASLLDAAEQAPLDALERASVREMRRQWAVSNLLPARLVAAQSLAGSRCEHAWRSQRPANDWAALVPNLRTVVDLAREEAGLLAEHFGCSRYEALMNKHEPGMRCAELDRIFADVKSWLPALIRQVMDRQATEPVLQPIGPFAAESQRALGLDVMKLLGFDFEAGRLDLSAHPFCAGVPEDVRITTRYRDDNFLQGLMGIIHETGHARYEQRLPPELVHLPIGRARTMGVHESQSLSFEMQLGRSAAFLTLITPLVRQHLGTQPALQANNLARLCTRVRPGFIRVDADELSYPAHVILRYEIERALIEGEIEVEDIPTLWDEKMKASLDVDTRGNFTDGCMHDIHWPMGLIGYFPSYTLGAMYAAQYFATIRAANPDLDQKIAAGDLSPVTNWLEANIWSQASRWEISELMTQATGQTLQVSHFRKHLESRYLGSH